MTYRQLRRRRIPVMSLTEQIPRRSRTLAAWTIDIHITAIVHWAIADQSSLGHSHTSEATENRKSFGTTTSIIFSCSYLICMFLGIFDIFMYLRFCCGIFYFWCAIFLLYTLSFLHTLRRLRRSAYWYVMMYCLNSFWSYLHIYFHYLSHLYEWHISFIH